MARRSGRSVSEALIRLSGAPNFLGTIDFTGSSKTNRTASTPFGDATTGLAGKILLLQPDQDCYVELVKTSATATSSTTGFKIFSGERVQVTMPDLDAMESASEEQVFVACIQSGAGGNLKIWELK